MGKTDRQTYRKTDRYRQTDRRTDGRADTHTHTHTHTHARTHAHKGTLPLYVVDNQLYRMLQNVCCILSEINDYYDDYYYCAEHCNF